MAFWSVESHQKWNKDQGLVGHDGINSQVIIISFSDVFHHLSVSALLIFDQSWYGQCNLPTMKGKRPSCFTSLPVKDYSILSWMRFHIPVAINEHTWILSGMGRHTVISLVHAIKIRLLHGTASVKPPIMRHLIIQVFQTKPSRLSLKLTSVFLKRSPIKWTTLKVSHCDKM